MELLPGLLELEPLEVLGIVLDVEPDMPLEELLGHALLLDELLGDDELLDDDGLLDDIDELLDDIDELLDEASLPMPEVLLELDELPEPETPSAASVFESSEPLALMPCCCWNCFTAARVCGPSLPSAVTFMPLPLRACCASRIVDESDELALPDAVAVEEALLPVDDVSLLVDEAGVPAAKAAVLDRMIAASDIFRRSMVVPFIPGLAV